MTFETSTTPKSYVDTQGASLSTSTSTGLSSTNNALASLSTSIGGGGSTSAVSSSVESLSTSTSTGLSAANSSIDGKLSGVGVAGRVAFYNGTNSVESDAVLVYSSSNKRLGVNQGTPAHAVDAVGALRALNTGTTNQFLIDPLDAIGPKIKLGTSSDPVAFWEMGAYNSINNFDNKGRTLRIFNNASQGAFWLNGANGYVGLQVTAAPISRFANTSTAQIGTNGVGVDVANGTTWTATTNWAHILRNSGVVANANGMSIQTDGTANTNTILEAASGVTKSQKWAVLGTGDAIHSGNIQIKNTFVQYNQVASFTADTVGDIRTIKVGSNLQVQQCTVANSVKGAGTWVTPKYALTNSARFSSIFTLGKTLNTAVTIGTAWTDLTWLFCGNAQANAASGVNIRSQFYYDSANNLLRCLNDSQEGFTFIALCVLSGSITNGGAGDVFEIALFRPDDTTLIRSRLDATPSTATVTSGEYGNMNFYIVDGGNDNFQLAPVGTPVSTVPYPVYPTGNAGGFRIKIRRSVGNAVFTLSAARQEIRLFN